MQPNVGKRSLNRPMRNSAAARGAAASPSPSLLPEASTGWELAKLFESPMRIGDLRNKFAGYFVVGGASALADFALFSLFLLGGGIHYLTAATLSFILATGLNYTLSVRYVFRDGKRPRHHEILMVYFASAVGILVNLGVLAMAVEIAGLHPLIGKIAGTASAFGWNFGTRYFWIFRPADTDTGGEPETT